MYIKLAILSCAVVACVAQLNGFGSGGSSFSSLFLDEDNDYNHGHHVDYYTHPKYEFKYGVSDDHTHDHHSQHEYRDGDVVHGEYSLHEPDGTIRIVKYTADPKNGFNAEVIRKGHAKHPETHVKHPFKVFAHHGHAYY